jgi:hypothetical protein
LSLVSLRSGIACVVPHREKGRSRIAGGQGPFWRKEGGLRHRDQSSGVGSCRTLGESLNEKVLSGALEGRRDVERGLGVHPQERRGGEGEKTAGQRFLGQCLIRLTCSPDTEIPLGRVAIFASPWEIWKSTGPG